MVAIQPDADVARAARTLLDRDLVAGGRALYRASSQRRRAKRTEAGRERALRCSARCRGRLTGWRVLEHPWPAFRHRVLLLGHQGWEYLDLGRVWQSGLFLGLLIWLVLMLRVIWPALAEKGERRNLVVMFALSAGAIALFYGA